MITEKAWKDFHEPDRPQADDEEWRTVVSTEMGQPEPNSSFVEVLFGESNGFAINTPEGSEPVEVGINEDGWTDWVDLEITKDSILHFEPSNEDGIAFTMSYAEENGRYRTVKVLDTPDDPTTSTEQFGDFSSIEGLRQWAVVQVMSLDKYRLGSLEDIPRFAEGIVEYILHGTKEQEGDT